MKFTLRDFILNFWDLGGQADLRSLWDNYLEQCHAIVFIIDSLDQTRHDEAITCLGNKQLYHVLPFYYN